MNKFVAIFATTVVLVATLAAASPNYGSYITLCNSQSDKVTFHNFKEQNCSGAFTTFTKPLDGCHKELVFFSWNGFCNQTNMWYNNFKNGECKGRSVLTRMYVTNQCRNCLNKECKCPPGQIC